MRACVCAVCWSCSQHVARRFHASRPVFPPSASSGPPHDWPKKTRRWLGSLALAALIMQIIIMLYLCLADSVVGVRAVYISMYSIVILCAVSSRANCFRSPFLVFFVVVLFCSRSQTTRTRTACWQRIMRVNVGFADLSMLSGVCILEHLGVHAWNQVPLPLGPSVQTRHETVMLCK